MADTTKKTVTYEIQGDSTKLIRTIEGAMRQIDMLETRLSRVAIKKDISPVSEGSTRDALDRIASVTRAINNLEKTQATLESVDLELLSEPQLQLIKVASEEIKNLAKDMGNLRDAGKVSQEQLDKVESTTRRVNQAIKDAGITTINFEAVATKAARQTAQEAKQAAQEYQTTLRGIKNAITSIVGVLRTLITAGYNLMSEAADFGETMNKFNVVAGDSAQVLGDFADRLAAAYGLDPKDLYEGVASFKSVANSINLADDAAEKFTKNLMSLSLDLSSLYNTSVDQAMNALVSGLHGQERAMKQYNVYLYEANIQQKAYDLGLKKSTQSMNEAEKMCLRYMVAMDQTKEAQGDLQRTLSSASNQMKIVQAQFAQLRRSLGQIVTVIGMTVVPALNALLGGLVKVFTFIASKMGYEIEDFANAFDNNTDATDDAAEALQEYSDAAAGLSGLDEINLITPTTTAGSDTGMDMDLTKVDQSILDAMQRYQDLSDGIAGTFSDLADKIATSLEGTLTATLFETIVSGLANIGNAIDFVVDHWEAFEPIIKTLIDLLTIFLAIKVADTMLGWAKHFGTAFGALQKFSIQLPLASKNMQGMVTPANNSAGAIDGLTLAFSAFTFAAGQAIASSVFDRLSEDNRKIAAAIAIAVAALVAGTTAWLAYHGAMTYGVAVPIITGAIGVGVAAVKAMIPSVPKMATGGVVDSPTMAMIGEGRYSEAVVPLGNSPQFAKMKEEIADAVTQKLSSIQINVQMGNEALSSIQNIETQTETLSKFASSIFETLILISTYIAATNKMGVLTGVATKVANKLKDIRNSAPKLASGGVVNQPTVAMIGEGRYNEAVVPLGNSPQFTAMKGEIAEEVARKLAQTPYSPYGSTSRGSQANVILQVNGRELARALLPDLGITRPQTGVKLV